MTELPKVEIWTDGACHGNPGPGGHAAVLHFEGQRKNVVGGEPLTTNNRMELMAAIMGLESLQIPHAVTLYADSEYVIKGMTQWIAGWKSRGWRTASRAPVKNDDLWKRLDEAAKTHQVTWQWVKGHSTFEFNQEADELSRNASLAFKQMGPFPHI